MISMSVCVSVSLSVCVFARVSQELHVLTSPHLLCTLPMAVARYFSGGVALRYVLPVLWMTSYFSRSATVRRTDAGGGVCDAPLQRFTTPSK